MGSLVVAQLNAGLAMARRASSVLAAALGLLVGLAGCVAPGSTVAPGASGGRAALSVPDQPLAKARTYPTASITLAPPDGRVASVPAEVAYDLCRTGVADCPDGQPTSAELASITDTRDGTSQADGTLMQPLDDTLVWAFSWRNITCPPSSGGAFMPASSRPFGTAAATICDEVAFVDATSGGFLFTYTGPPAP
jgi:hypothetical protein